MHTHTQTHTQTQTHNTFFGLRRATEREPTHDADGNGSIPSGAQQRLCRRTPSCTCIRTAVAVGMHVTQMHVTQMHVVAYHTACWAGRACR